ncbi:hypothetical protein MPER_03728 [Moniliophthora perniciosa FA553]|nr:hypothetical protein MPER_03728 [Moniliophthora perniciosa FA553]
MSFQLSVTASNIGSGPPPTFDEWMANVVSGANGDHTVLNRLYQYNQCQEFTKRHDAEQASGFTAPVSNVPTTVSRSGHYPTFDEWLPKEGNGDYTAHNRLVQYKKWVVFIKEHYDAEPSANMHRRLVIRHTFIIIVIIIVIVVGVDHFILIQFPIRVAIVHIFITIHIPPMQNFVLLFDCSMTSLPLLSL